MISGLVPENLKSALSEMFLIKLFMWNIEGTYVLFTVLCFSAFFFNICLCPPIKYKNCVTYYMAVPYFWAENKQALLSSSPIIMIRPCE